MEGLLRDVKYSLRQILKNPGFSLSIILTLALGIGTNAAIFSMVHAVLLRPLPYAGGDCLVHIGYRTPGPDVSDVTFSVQEMKEYRQRSRALASVEEYHSMVFTLLGQGDPDRVRTGVVSAGFFDHFGVKPLLGRFFVAGEDQPGAEPVLLFSHPYWRRHFLGDPGIVGKNVILDGKSARVVGVLPPLPLFPEENDVFLPASGCSIRSSERTVSNRKARMLSLFGRLKPQTTIEQARAEAASLVRGWRQESPDLYPEESYHDIPIIPVQEELTSDFRVTLLVLLATVGMVLLLACFNVANLTLARMMRREREVAVRSALGAGRGRLMAQLLTESTVLSLAGGAVGLVLAFSGLGLLTAFAGRFTPRASEIAIDGQVLLFTFVISLLTGLLFGVFPAFQASVRNVAAAIKAGGRATVNAGGRRFRALLTVLQVAISFILLIGAGLAIRSFLNLREVDPGFKLKDVLVMTITLPPERSTTEERVAFYDPLLEELQSLPGVTAAGLSSTLPLDGSADGSPSFAIEGRSMPEGEARASFNIASDGFFRTLRIPLTRGRMFTTTDVKSTPLVVIINESFARRYWPGEDPIGHRVTFSYPRTDDPLTIVGVVRDIKQLGLGVETRPAFYLPYRQIVGREVKLFLHTAGDPLRMVHRIADVVHQRDAQLPVTDVRTLEEVRDKGLAPARLTAILLALFAALAGTVAVLGISGVVASSVTERTHEIGIRSALGAERGRLLRMVLWQGMAPVVVGLIAGALGAAALTRFLSSILFGVVPNDLLTYASAAALLLAAAAVACLVPARHAMSIDPLLALRYE